MGHGSRDSFCLAFIVERRLAVLDVDSVLPTGETILIPLVVNDGDLAAFARLLNLLPKLDSAGVKRHLVDIRMRRIAASLVWEDPGNACAGRGRDEFVLLVVRGARAERNDECILALQGRHQ